MKLWTCGFWCIILALSGSNAGCARAPAKDEAKDSPPEPKKVSPERHTLRHTIGLPGHVEAFEQTPIYTKIAGFIEKYHVDIGDPVSGPLYDVKDTDVKVKDGQILAKLWVPEMIAELDRKKALANKSAAEIKQAEEIVKVADANLRSAEFKVKELVAGRVRAQAEYERWKIEVTRIDGLVRKGTVDQQTGDETRFQLEGARAGTLEVEAKVQSSLAVVKERQAQLDKAKIDVVVARARHQAAKADQAYVAALLAYADVRAPFSGIVTQRLINTGDFVQPAAAGGSKGQSLFVVARIDKVRIPVEVPETDAVLIDKNAKVRIRLRGVPGQEFDGSVARSSWGLSHKSRTLRAEIDMKNPGNIRPGMYAFATIIVEHKKVWTLPVEAVVMTGDQPFCFRIEEGKAVRTPVQVGINDGKRVEVERILVGRDGGESWDVIRGNEEIAAGDAASRKP